MLAKNCCLGPELAITLLSLTNNKDADKRVRQDMRATFANALKKTDVCRRDFRKILGCFELTSTRYHANMGRRPTLLWTQIYLQPG